MSSKDSINSSNIDLKYPVYKEVLHNYKPKAGTERTSKRVNDCPVFKPSDGDHKKDLLDIIKENHSLCSKCSSWTHETKECNQTFTCYDCQGDHQMDLYTIQKLFSSTLMSLQDANIDSQTIAHCLFDNGSEATTIKKLLQRDIIYIM